MRERSKSYKNTRCRRTTCWAQDITNSRIGILFVKIVLAIYQGPVDPTTRVSFLFAVSTCVFSALCAHTQVKLFAHFRVFVLPYKH